MKFRPAHLGFAQSLVALSVSLAVVLSGQTFAFASLAKSAGPAPSAPSQKQTDTSHNELQIVSATATATAAGVLLQWRTNSATDNLGFNVYRLKAGQRTRVNKEIIPGAVFASGPPGLMRGGHSYAWFDRGGTADTTYFIESINLVGTAKTFEPLSPVTGKTAPGFEQTPDALTGADATESSESSEKYYPAAGADINSPQGALEDQWAIAAQTTLKIAIKKDGWYRVTQPQMVAAGFNPTVDIRNLRLFVEAQEVAINTSQHSGLFGIGDYIEFYGRGLDKPTTDARIYYLLAGTSPGKRVRGEIQLDDGPILPPPPTSTPTPPLPTPGSSPVRPSGPPAAPQLSPSTSRPVLQDPVFFSWVQRDLDVWTESLRPKTQEQTAGAQEQTAGADNRSRQESANSSFVRDYSVAEPDAAAEANVPVANANAERTTPSTNPVPNVPTSGKAAAAPSVPAKPIVPATPAGVPRRAASGKMRSTRKSRKGASSKKKKKTKPRREFRQERNHPVLAAALAPPNYAFTAERKDRTVYYLNGINGDAENWFGQVLFQNLSNPQSQTINTPNPDLAAGGTAQLEIALQGVNLVTHQISIEFNGVVVGSFSFFGNTLPDGHPVQVFNIPVTSLQNSAVQCGASPCTNTIRFLVGGSPDTSIVDYVRITYPHLFRADAGALRFSLRGTQSRQVDGFATASVRLIDYTDPLNVRIAKPASEPSGPGFAITVPTSDPPSKPDRLLYAIPEGQFDQPASLSLSQPSTLNQGILSPAITTGADFLVISHKTFIPSLAPLLSQRQSQQGLIAAAVDVEDVFDEFGFGEHGPKAIRDFLSHASTHWVTKPRYVIFAGDATYDPRDYLHLGNFDLVPTKLVDATFNETSSDDWLTDFDNNQIADIPVGRLPVRTVAEADKVIEKIVNFLPANVPQAAMLVADDPTNYFFNFEVANDQVQALLPPSMTVQRVNVRIDGPAQAKINVIAGFNQGRALVNYSGHGNVNVWTGSSVFTSNEAFALTNGNKLSFVVVMDCLNGYFQELTVTSIAEALLKAPNGGAVAAFASSGLTFPDGQHDMSEQLYILVYGTQPIALGDAIKIAKASTNDLDVRKTWIFFGDPSMKIR